MKKALIVASIWPFFNFEKNDIKLLQEKGYEVHCATNYNAPINREVDINDVVKHQICFSRSPFSKDNIMAYVRLKILITQNQFDLIHCHTPIAGFLTRIAARHTRKNGTKIIYTSHGYHFYKNGSKKNWIIFFPLEKMASRFTDAIITINEEDRQLTKDRFHMKEVYRIPGVGIELSRFNLNNYKRDEYRKTLGLEKTDIAIVSVGEVNTNKNHSLVIYALALLKNEKIHYFVAGAGNKISEDENIAKRLGIDRQVHFLGYRTDIPELDSAADIFAFPSIREGLGLAPIEAMACGVPVVGMDTRGINEYCIDNDTGFLFKNSPESCADAINKCIELKATDCDVATRCKSKAREYSKENTETIMKGIYGAL